jgi:hypothetical protein
VITQGNLRFDLSNNELRHLSFCSGVRNTERDGVVMLSLFADCGKLMALILSSLVKLF